MSIRPLLHHRAVIRSSLRHQLESRGFIEVDTPVVGSELLPEIYIERVPSRPTDPAALALTVLAKLLRD